MITIQEIREKYPEYEDMSDIQIADSLHSKHYNDLPKEDFYQKIGLSNNKKQEGGFLRDSADTLLNSIIGAGDAATNLPKNLHNLLTPQSMNVPIVDRNLGQGYGLGKVAGDIGSFIGSGGAAGGARLAAEGVPYLGKAAEALGGEGLQGLARRALGSAGYGAVQNPEERGSSALESGALSALLDTLGGAGKIGKKIPEALSYLDPEKYLKKAEVSKDSLIDLLGGGRTLEENKKALASDIKNAYKIRKKESTDLYKTVFDEVGENRFPSYQYNGVHDTAYKVYDHDLKNLHDKFLLNPTVKNAHDLQSQLGSSVRDLKNLDASGNLTPNDRNTMQLYRDAQSSLKNDIDHFLSEKHPGVSEKYKYATKNYAENVTPYFSNANLSKISKGKITNPKVNTLVNLFKSPQEGAENSITKVLNDLGPEAHKKILFSELGKYSQRKSPKSLISNVDRLDERGLGSYVSPEIKNRYDEINELNKLHEESNKGLSGFARNTVSKFIPSSLFELGNSTKSDSVAPLYELAKKLLISNI